MRRRRLARTKPARLLLAALRLGISLQLIAGLILLVTGLAKGNIIEAWIGSMLLVSYPVLWAYLIVLPLVLGRLLIVAPKEQRLIASSKAIFADHPGITIAVAGSYGKTSMKELLATVLKEGKKVAVTPANKNVAISHAYFARKLSGDEDVLIIEYGEGKAGDVRSFAETTSPDIGIITGLAPAHLDQYKNLDEAARDIFTLADYLHDKEVYVNGEASAVTPYLKPSHTVYTSKSVGEWKISDVSTDFDGTSFTLTNDNQKLACKSSLLGRHQVGPLAAAAVIALGLGLSKEQVIKGLAATAPFEHRMQPRHSGGAWLIDDTYNGTIEGMKAGLQLLAELPGKRKIYVTPGLVDQGAETERVHVELGQAIGESAPDLVILMRNSVTQFIEHGMQKAGFKGKLQIEDDPLDFYTGLDHFTAAGDVVLMQNDWTDNYA
jgi:UDP-N-acetylmuramoyl-tripeptide--D-alanyl-D-alanine ligase